MKLKQDKGYVSSQNRLLTMLEFVGESYQLIYIGGHKILAMTGKTKPFVHAYLEKRRSQEEHEVLGMMLCDSAIPLSALFLP